MFPKNHENENDDSDDYDVENEQQIRDSFKEKLDY